MVKRDLDAIRSPRRHVIVRWRLGASALVLLGLVGVGAGSSAVGPRLVPDHLAAGTRSQSLRAAAATQANEVELSTKVSGPVPRSQAARAPSTRRQTPGDVVVRVAGNQLVNGAGEPIRLVGVDRSGSEYACIQDWGIFDGPTDAASVDAMLSWDINAVRVPLNEDCWLGINGVAAQYGGAAYRSAIASYVRTLEDAGLVVILDLHWNAPGTQRATGQQEMADEDHSPAFWRSVARYFKSNHGLIFDLYNEPHDISWSCWLKGCQLSSDWQAAGMQQLVNAVRSTGATQPLMAGGLNWSGDLSQWLQHEPVDPLHQLVASVHIYNFSECNTSSCWQQTIAPVAQAVPVVTGELGEDDCQQGFIDSYMSWADENGISYLGWSWDAGGGWTCTNGPSLITTYAGNPTPYGAGLQSHLAAISSGEPPPVHTPPPPTVPHAVGIAVASTGGRFWVAFSNGVVIPHDNARLYGSMAKQKLRQPIVAITATPDGRGYWLVGADGGVFAFGDAGYYGSTGSIRLSKPIVGMAATPDGRGYLLVAADGGLFAFGNARFLGSMGGRRLGASIVGMAVDQATGGYWLAAADGGIFAFGASFFGSGAGIHIGRSVVGIAAAADGGGYRLATSNGGVFSFHQPFLGSIVGHTGGQAVVAIGASSDPRQYMLVQFNGTVRSFGVTPPPLPGRLTATFQPSSQWSGGYVGTFTISDSGSPVSSWVLSFKLPTRDQITNEWGGQLSRKGQTYVIANYSWDGDIVNGASASVGIQVTEPGPYSPPTSCTVNSKD
jgi:hypothetical protein